MLKNWKTTAAGLGAGLLVGGQAVLDAWQAGAFTGKSGAQLTLGVLFVVFGAISKDHDVTGGTKPQ